MWRSRAGHSRGGKQEAERVRFKQSGVSCHAGKQVLYFILFGKGVLTLKKDDPPLHYVLLIWQKRTLKLRQEVTFPRRARKHFLPSWSWHLRWRLRTGHWVVRQQTGADRSGLEPQGWEDCDSGVGTLRGQVSRFPSGHLRLWNIHFHITFFFF